ncbi:MAG: hypothetical protein IT370_18310 [Deltaproteobacteria bacterium]|nr:hypothetical protein [Deltaproteobacteria bacterium]
MFKLKAAHQRALGATLRVTLMGTLAAGCGGSGSGGAPHSTKPSPTPAVSAAAAAADPSTEAECRTALGAAYPNGDDSWYEPQNPTPRKETEVSTAALVSCCERHADALGTQDYRTLGCCSARFDGAHCTPWGPPMPPAMPA